METTCTTRPGRGLDIGTENLVVAGRGSDDAVQIRREKNAFLAIPAGTGAGRETFARLGVPCIVRGENVFVLGDAPAHIRGLTGAKEKRLGPGGILSPSHPDAISITSSLLKALLGPPVVEDEPVAFSLPERPLDWEYGRVLHEGIVAGILKKLGYAPAAVTEGLAVVYAELAKSDFTGVAISFGGHLVNACFALNGEPVEGFSFARGGDWIDEEVSRIMGVRKLEAVEARTGGMDLDRPRTRLEQAIERYHVNLVRYLVANFASRIRPAARRLDHEGPFDVALAGGVTRIGGFARRAGAEFRRPGFPLPIGRVFRSDRPDLSTATGCLLAAAL